MARTLWILLLVVAAIPARAKDDAAAVLPSTTNGKVTIGDRTLEYAATANLETMRDEDGGAVAEIFHVDYLLAGADPETRPITFVFNGGPGSSSIWLHLGTIGPRRVEMGEEGFDLKPPSRSVECVETWLAFTDLVFIDPVGTGYSRPAKGHAQKEFSGLDEDTRSVGEFIRHWVTTRDRWSSPKYLAGESYGTTRAAGLADYLQGRHGMFLNGVLLVSTVLNFQTIRPAPGNDLPYVLIVPSFTATAAYHGKLDEELAKDPTATLRAVEAFALEEYLVALAKGDALGDDARDAVAAKLARFTGLSKTFVLESNLRVSQSAFCKELLRDRRRTVGRLDSRYLGIDRDAAGDSSSYDPSMSAIDGPFSTALAAYLKGDLEFSIDRTYETLTGRVHPWKYPEGRYADVSERLRSAMTKNRSLRVFVASGTLDLATPYFAADYTLRHLMLDPTLRGNVHVRYYEAGHMMYIHAPSRRTLRDDVAAFYSLR